MKSCLISVQTATCWWCFEHSVTVSHVLMLDPESRDMYHCLAYRFYEICIPPVNEPIRSYQIHSLKQFKSRWHRMLCKIKSFCRETGPLITRSGSGLNFLLRSRSRIIWSPQVRTVRFAFVSRSVSFPNSKQVHFSVQHHVRLIHTPATVDKPGVSDGHWWNMLQGSFTQNQKQHILH